MLIISALIAFYALVLLIGKYVPKLNYSGYFAIAVITVIEALVIYLLLFTMQVPTP